MPFETWLELRSGAAGLRGPFLIEHFRAYSALDRCLSPPKLLIAIGGENKRRYLRTILPGERIIRSNGVHLRQLSSSALIADCEMHESRRLERVKAGPVPGNCHQHELSATLPDAASHFAIKRLSHKLYWQLVAQFSSCVIIFSDDLGGFSEVIDMLVVWARQSMFASFQAPLSLVIVGGEPLEAEQVNNEIQLRVDALIRRQLHFTGKSHLAADHRLFESVHFFSVAPCADVLLSHANSCNRRRETSGYAFSSHHLKYFLHYAICHFSQNQGPSLDLCYATRLHRLVPERLAGHIVNFITVARRATSFDVVPVIASALQLDAYPPRMHFFSPEHLFDKFYHMPVSVAEKMTSHVSLLQLVRDSFVDLSKRRDAESSIRQHLTLLAEHSLSWQDCLHEETCFICLSQIPTVTLTCQHRLCEHCVQICGVAEHWNYKLTRCPLCRAYNESDFLLRPPTAGVRVLKLGGSFQEKNAIVQFLKELQSAVGLVRYPLSKHFDVVVGSDIGAYFTQTIFMEGWCLADSRYHLKRLSEPKVRRSIAQFGKGLDWDLSKTKSFNTPKAVLVVKDRIFSNLESSLSATSLLKPDPYPADIVVQYSGGTFCSTVIQSIASRLFSYLFYLELIALPKFYSVPEQIKVRLLCRVPPGPSLVELISNLYRKNTKVHYQGDGPKQVHPLVTSAAFRRCRNGEQFSKVLEISVDSLDTLLDIKIDGASGKENISNCPYNLKKLVHDQGLDSMFGWSTTSTQNDASAGLMFEEIERLVDTLRGFED